MDVSEWMKFLKTEQAKQISDKAKAKAWNDFKTRYPNADVSLFTAEVKFVDKKSEQTLNLRRVMVYCKVF